VDEVLKAAADNLNRVAMTKSKLTYANTIRPLKLAPNYKTNHLVCQSKFLQHASPNAEVRAAAEVAGKTFATFKSSSRLRRDVFDRVLK
jgi:Zn-dependent oligopeptidase